MLARMGYREGGGLGRSGDGRAAPLELVVKVNESLNPKPDPQSETLNPEDIW